MAGGCRTGALKPKRDPEAEVKATVDISLLPFQFSKTWWGLRARVLKFMDVSSLRLNYDLTCHSSSLGAHLSK